jgi:cysteine desulfurase
MTPSSATAYFDWNATAPLGAAARQAMADALEVTGNPSSVHGAGRAARALVERAREKILASLGSPKANLVFTASGTEALNLALRGLVQAAAEKGERITRLIVSAVEHDAVLQTAAAMEAEIAGLRVTHLAPDANGQIAPETLRLALMEGKGRALVAIMLANNETGVLNPILKLAKIARENGAAFVCDAVQAWGRLPLDAKMINADALVISAHKAGGPKGAAALILREGVVLSPQLRGGGQELGLRAGTHNVAAIAGFGAASEFNLEPWAALESRRDRLERELLELSPQAIVYGRGAPRLPNTICIGLPGVLAETQVIALDLDGVAVSAGAACSSGKLRPSHVLTAMGASPEAAAAAIRISFGPSTSPEDCTRLLKAWGQLARRAHALSGRPAA